MTADPFELADIRDRVLAGWTAAPVRFREDANAEEELVLGGYRDRLVVELAQNAADAAGRAGVPGRLLLALRELDGGAVLVAANTGHQLDRDGVQALATLRASAKRDTDEQPDGGIAPGGLAPVGSARVGSVGRFGVGFAAVLAVTDSPALLSRSGGVRFSGPDTHALVEQAAAATPGLVDELARRDGHVPVLRLPFEAEGSPPDGYDTAVLLPLRDAAAEDLVVRLLDEVGDPLLLALPGLTEIVIDLPDRPARTVTAVADRWHVHGRSGRFASGLLADRPSEERRRTGWQVTWALPRGPDVRVPTVLHAPTPSDEPLPWPALLIAGFPLDSTRRHVAAGPATDLLVSQAAQAYAELLEQRAAAGDDVLPLVPVGLPAGVIDGALRVAVLSILPAVPLLPEGGPGAGERLLVRPRDAVALDPPAGTETEVVAGLARWLAGLVLASRAGSPALAALGVRRMSLADLVEALPSVSDPLRWQQVYAALDQLAVDPLVREALADLPVPLADGRVVRGARGLLLRSGADHGHGYDPAALRRLGVRVVDPRAAHPLLERLGAVATGPRGILDLPAVQAAVESSPDDDDPQPIAAAVLALVAEAVAGGELAPGELPWLADLALTDVDGEPTPAGALALPGSVAAQVFDPDEIALVDQGLVAAWGRPVLAALGVLDGPALLRAADVELSPAGSGDDSAADPGSLDGWPQWVAASQELLVLAGAGAGESEFGPAPVVAELLAVRDLDAVGDDRLPLLVEAIAADPRLRAAVVDPARVLAGRLRVDVPSYTAWWLRRRIAAGAGPVLDPQADPVLHGLFPPAPDWLAGVDAGVRRALSAVSQVADLGPDGAAVLVRRLADPGLEVSVPTVLACWRRLAELGAAGVEVEPVERVRVLAAGSTAVLPAGQAVVVDDPMYLQRTDLGAPLVVPAGSGPGLADLLDLPLARELAPGQIQEAAAGGRPAPLPAGALLLLGAGAGQVAAQWCEHDDGLLVDGVDVEWWVDDDGLVHAGTLHGLAAGLAWSCGLWERRMAVAAVLLEPQSVGELLVDQAFDAGSALR